MNEQSKGNYYNPDAVPDSIPLFTDDTDTSTKTPEKRRPTITRYIHVKAQVEGIHAWPQCPYPEVGFLKFPHRHIFEIVAVKQVTHGDREVEIIKLRRAIEAHLIECYAIGGHGSVCEFGSMSCEMIAEHLIEQFDLSACEVLEDGENGAVVYATTEPALTTQQVYDSARKGAQDAIRDADKRRVPLTTQEFMDAAKASTSAAHAQEQDMTASDNGEDPSACVRRVWSGVEVEGRYKGLKTLFFSGELLEGRRAPANRRLLESLGVENFAHLFLCPDVITSTHKDLIASFVGICRSMDKPVTVAVYPRDFDKLHPFVKNHAHIMLDIHAHEAQGLKPSDTIKVETAPYTTLSTTVEQMVATRPEHYDRDDPR